MLILLLIIPLIGILLMLPLNEKPNPLSENSNPLNENSNNDPAKQIALLTSVINLLVSIYIWSLFDSSTMHYQFVSEFTEISFCQFHLGVDGLSIYFVLLTTFITPFCILSNWTDIKIKPKYFYISFLLLETLQIAVFIVLELFLFYVFFESVLIPLFLIIITWGASEARIRAGYLLFLYTLFGSLFMLLAILALYFYYGTTDYLFISLYNIIFESQNILWFAFFLSFAIKTPLLPAHLWLFRAHAEAPLAGSIILAAIILKLATYGYIRILIPILDNATNFFVPFVQAISIITLIFASLSTIRQTDLKQWIAYSSVAHMGVVVLGIMSNTVQGIEGAIALSIAHGFVSSALFICVGGIVYSRTHSRIIFYFRGLVSRMPLFVLLFFLFVLFNTGIPLTLNFLGEFLSLTGLWKNSPILAYLGGSGILLSALYTVFPYNRISYGKLSKHLKTILDISRLEYFLLITLLIPTIAFGILPDTLLQDLHSSVSNIMFTIVNQNNII